MALATESAGHVRQKAYNAVYGTGTGTSSDSVSPYHFYAVKALFLHLAANKGNPDLQFVAYSAEQAANTTTNDGAVLMDAACTLYAWYGKARRTSGTTASWQMLYDAAAIGGDSDPVSDEISIQLIRATGQQFFDVHPNGFAAAAGIVIRANTAVDGATVSSAADATDGFIIVG